MLQLHWTYYQYWEYKLHIGNICINYLQTTEAAGIQEMETSVIN